MPPSDHEPPARSLYDVLAPVYDRWQAAGGMTPFSEVVLDKLLPALDRYAPGADRSFLDLGCGTGELLLGVARARPRWRLLGVDGSAGMLEIARGKPGAERITWTQSPLTAPAIPRSALDAAGCFYDTLNHLTEIAALDGAFAAVAGALGPGGLFIFDTTNELGFDRWWRGNRTWRGRGWSVAVETRFDAATSRAQAEVVVEHGDELACASLTERCFREAEIRAALAAAGLEVIVHERWSPFDIDAPGKTWWIGRNRLP